MATTKTYTSFLKECKKKWWLFLVALLLAVGCAHIVTDMQPDNYVSEIEISDEHRENMDLAIGMSHVYAAIKRMQPLNDGITNDADLYTQFLKSESFYRDLMNVYVEKYKQSYYEYIVRHHKEPKWKKWVSDEEDGPRDTAYVAQILDKSIFYKIKTKYYTVSISFLDNDAEVSAAMVDTIGARLDAKLQDIWSEQHGETLRELQELRAKKYQEYKETIAKFNTLVDDNLDVETEALKSEMENLQREKDNLWAEYNDLTIQALRSGFQIRRGVPTFTTVKNATVPLEKYQPTPVTSFFAFLFIFTIIAIWIIAGRKTFVARRRILWGTMSSPWCITLIVWGAILFFMQFRDPEFLNPLKTQFYSSLALWLPIYCIASVLTYNCFVDKDTVMTNNSVDRNANFNKFFFNFFFVFTVVCTPLLMYKVYQVVSMFDSDEMLSNIRLLANEGGEDAGFLKYTYVINEVLFVVALWYHPRVPLWQVIVLAGTNVLSAIAIMEKGAIFFLAIATLYILFEKQVVKVRTIMLTLVTLFGFFFLFNFLREGESAEDSDASNIFGFVAMYILSPCVAYETVSEELVAQTGAHTFEVVYRFLDGMGVPGIVVNEKLQEFVFVPIVTNVYTIFQPFFKDFGYNGIAFFALFYGVMTGFVYSKARSGSYFAKAVYSYFMVYALVLQFYQENIFLSMTMFTQYVLISLVICQNKIRFVVR